MNAEALEVQSKTLHEFHDHRHELHNQHQSLVHHVNRLENVIPSIQQIEDIVHAQMSSLAISATRPLALQASSSGLQQLTYAPIPQISDQPFFENDETWVLTKQSASLEGLGNDRVKRYRSPHLPLAYQDYATAREGVVPVAAPSIPCPQTDKQSASLRHQLGQPPAVFVNQQAEAINQITTGIMLLIRNLALLYPQFICLLYMLQVKLVSIPRSVSNLLNDNIVLVDFLGRQHSLQYCNFKQWSVVYAMLRTRFDDCPGGNYIIRHQFILEMQLSRGGFQPFNPQTWSELKPRSRVFMSARLAKVPFNSSTCTACGDTVYMTPRKTWHCSSCRIDYRSLDPEVLPASNELMEQAQKLAPSALGHSLRWRNARRSSALLDAYLERIAVSSWQTDWKYLRVMEAKQQPIASVESQYELLAHQVNRIWYQRADQYRHESAMVRNSEKPFLGIIQYRLMRPRILGVVSDFKQEMQDLRSFKFVSLRGTALVHDAALGGDEELLERLIRSGEDALYSRGPWGSPLDAAVLSGSVEVVRSLLQLGADPMGDTGVLGSPIQAAAIKGLLRCHAVAAGNVCWSFSRPVPRER